MFLKLAAIALLVGAFISFQSNFTKNEQEVRLQKKTVLVSNTPTPSPTVGKKLMRIIDGLGEICGTVTASGGTYESGVRPVKADLEITTLDGAHVANTSSDSDGFYSVRVRPGKYKVKDLQYGFGADTPEVTLNGCARTDIDFAFP